jgi:hypothetical protein
VLRKLAFALVTALLFLAALEGLCRVGMRPIVYRILPSPEMQTFVDEEHLVFDPDLGWRPAARVDRAGIESPLWGHATDTPPVKPPGRLRGFALGDSQTAGAGLPEDRAWPKEAERVLRGRGLDVELLNAAAAGYRSSQILRLIETRLLAWDVDFLVVDCMLNDSPRLTRTYGGWSNDVRRVLFESRLYRLVWLGVAAARGQSLGPVGDVHIPQEPPQEGPGNLDLIAELARTRHIALVFVDYPFVADPVRSLAPADRLPAGVPVAPATEALRTSGAAAELFLDNNHLTLIGSEVVGRVVADTLEPVLRAR